MFKLIALFAAISCASAQVLTLNPLTLGTTQGAAAQTFNLAATQRLAPGLALRAPAQIALAPQQIALAAPRYAIAAPQQIAISAPRIALAPQQALLREESYPPQPYTFGFQSTDEFGTQLSRSEQADGSGAVTGSYSFAEADGRQRIVEYVADAAGFRATVKTNEPGTANANPADVQIQSSAPSRR